MTVGHAERLMPMMAATMDEAGWRWADVDVIAVTLGPGTFTGIRVALAAARALALAADRPCVGVSTMEAMAAARPSGQALLCVVRGRQDTIFVQRFDAAGRPEGEPLATAAGQLSALRRDGETLVDGPAGVGGQAVAVAALRRLCRGEPAAPGASLLPLYLREAEARADAGRPLVGRGSR